MSKEQKEEGLVKDLIHKIRKGEITEKEAHREIYRRGLEHGKYGSRVSNAVMTLGCILPRQSHVMLSPYSLRNPAFDEVANALRNIQLKVKETPYLFD